MPDKGFRTINVTEQVYEKIKTRAKEENKSISSFASHVLASFMEADERLSPYAPFIEVVGFEGKSAILRDTKPNRIVEVSLNDKKLFCLHDESMECVHVSFCHALPQVSRVTRP